MGINLKNSVLKGTIILTLAGVLSKVIGFFYRIYLTRTIGASGMGLMQLIMPVAGIAFAICSSGIQTAISRFCASSAVKINSKDNSCQSCGEWLIYGLFISIPIALLFTYITYTHSDFIATRLLLNEQSSPLIKILSFTFPFSCFHNCVNGFYFGYKKTAIPALSQLFEQVVRVMTVYIYAKICISNNIPITVVGALWGSLISEIASTIFCMIALKFSKNFTVKNHFYKSNIKKLFVFSLPLTLNRLLMHILQGCESILIPAQLIIYGHSQSESLSIYGVLTGMAIPFILFPAAITNSLSVMLLPEVSGAQSAKNNDSITRTIERSIHFCLAIGIFTTFLFLFYVGRIGSIIFNEPSVQLFILTLCWLCPFYYLAMILSSILNGLGHTTLTCIQSITSILIRIAFLIVVVPFYGITGYLWGLLISQIIICILHYISLYRLFNITPMPFKNIILPACLSLICIGISYIVYNIFTKIISNELLNLTIATLIASITFLIVCSLIHYYNARRNK